MLLRSVLPRPAPPRWSKAPSEASLRQPEARRRLRPAYWAKVQAVLKRHDILLIADEVVTGFGRLGAMFGSDHYGIEPDLVAIAKGLTSAYAPLSGVIVSDELWRVLVKGSDELGVIGHGWTYSAHPLCAAGGVANLELLDSLALVDDAREVGAYFRNALAEAVGGSRYVGDVRGEGLLAAVEFSADPETGALFDPALKIGPRIAAALLERGVIGRAMPQGDILGFAPPLLPDARRSRYDRRRSQGRGAGGHRRPSVQRLRQARAIPDPLRATPSGKPRARALGVPFDGEPDRGTRSPTFPASASAIPR